jgi:hypothetical protein
MTFGRLSTYKHPNLPHGYSAHDLAQGCFRIQHFAGIIDGNRLSEFSYARLLTYFCPYTYQ